MTSTGPVTRRYLLGCRNCGRSWQASYEIRSFTDDAGDHQLLDRDGAPAAAPRSTSRRAATASNGMYRSSRSRRLTTRHARGRGLWRGRRGMGW